MGELHEYDRGRLEGELAILIEVQDLLVGTEVPESVHDIIKVQITEVNDSLKYGFNEQGTGPDLP